MISTPILVQNEVPGQSMKTIPFRNILSPEYQSNNIDNCLVVLPTSSLKLTNLPAFSRSFPRVDKGNFPQKASR